MCVRRIRSDFFFLLRSTSCRSLRSLLDGEMEHSAGLRQETDLLKRKLAELEERHTGRIQALSR